MNSKKYKFNSEDMSKIGKGAAMAVIAAILTYLTQISTQIDFGAYTAIVVAVLSVAINAGRKFIKG